MGSQLPSDSLSSLKAKLTAANPEHSVLLQNAYALALVECAEALQYAIDYEAGEVGCVRHWKFVARDILEKLEAL
jgi:hypothetical protein